MKLLAALRRQHLPLMLLALAYLLAATPLLWPREARPGRLATGLERAPDALADAEGASAALAALRARGDAAIQARLDPRTGVARFVVPAQADGRLPYTPTAAELGKPEAIARGFLDQNRALFGLRSAADELRLLRDQFDRRLGFNHLRLEQVYKGLPVFGRQLVVHLDRQGEIVAVNGQFQPQIELDTRPVLTRDEAMQLALTDLKTRQLLPFELAKITLDPLPDETRLVVYVDYEGNATLAWEVTIVTAAPLGQWSYFVNARRPVVVHAIDGVMPVKRRRTYTAQNTTRIPGRLIVDEGERARDPVAQAAHDGAGRVYDYYANTFQRNSIDDQGMPLISTVNFGSDPQDAENAAWVGEYAQMIYGDGGRIFKPLPYGLDVVGHEFTHGVIDASSQLIYEVQSGALNESYADVFGAMIDRDDWLIGEDVIKAPPFPTPYLRSLEDPTAGGFYNPADPLGGVGQPGSMDEYANLPNSRRADNGGVHINSGVPNRAHYLMAQAIGREKTEQIAYRALTLYLTPTAEFIDALDASVRAAQDLYAQDASVADAVRAAFAQVGITSAGAEPGGPVVDPSDTPSGGPAPQRPQAPLPEGCTDIVVSGGFEQNTGWTEVVRGDTRIIDTQLPRSGRRSAWLGGTDQETTQLIYQDISIPANATNIELRYARLIHFESTGLLGALASDANFGTAFITPNGDVIAMVEELTSAQGDDQWRDVRFDVSRLAGKAVRLAFFAENPRGNISSMFVDDVAMIACTTGTGPSAPPTAGNATYIKGQITDASTGRGVEGAQFFVLRPGLTASQVAADDNITSDEVLTFGVTDRDGVYQTESAVPKGQRYSVIVFAAGYRPILADNEVAIPNDATNPYRVDAELRRGR